MTISSTTRFPRSAVHQAAQWPLLLNQRNQCDGLELLAALDPESIPLWILDLQYRVLLEKMRYGNEDISRGRRRSGLLQMNQVTIGEFIADISATLIPSDNLFLWTDKLHLFTGIGTWVGKCGLAVVYLVTWNKDQIGMATAPGASANTCSSCRNRQRSPTGVAAIQFGAYSGSTGQSGK